MTIKSRADHAPDDDHSRAMLAQIGEQVDAALMGHAQTLATALAMPIQAAYVTLLSDLFARAKQQAPAAVMDADGRVAQWRTRVRLYDTRHPDEPEADTDPDAPPGAQGTMIIAGLPEVAVYLGNVAVGYHKQQCPGLDHATLLHRLKSLRPTLSRRGGNATWRVPYSTQEGEWIARVDVERMSK